jgi:DnaK suppressor protein
MPTKRKATAKKTTKAKVGAKKTAVKKPAAKKAVKKTVAKKAAAPKAKKAVKKKAKATKTKTGGKKKPKESVTATTAKEKATTSEALTLAANKSNKVAKLKSNQKKSVTPSLPKKSTRSLSSLVTGPVDFTPYSEDSDEEYMNDQQNVHFAAILHRWKKELLEEIDKTVLHMKDEAANYADPNDRATQEEEFSLELRTRDRERKLIKKIDEALDRIKRNDYGYCESCGIEIGIKRLEARPTATLCIDCKTLEEIRERQMAG